MSSDKFGIDGRSLQLDEILLEGKNVEKVLEISSVDGLVSFGADGATLKMVDEAPAIRSRLTEVEFGNRKSKPTEHWLAY